MNPAPRNKFYSLQSRLMLMVVIVVMFPMLLATIFAFYSQKEQIDQSLARELNASLSSCMLYYRGLHEKLEMMTRAAANDNTSKTTLRLGVFPQLQKQIASLATEYQMDFLIVTDLHGKVVAYSSAKTDADLDLSNHPLVMQALQDKIVTVTFQEQHRSIVEMITSKESPPQDKCLLLESAAPIKIRDELIGTVLAGFKLSGNNAMLETMQKATGTDRIALVMNGAIIAASYQPMDRGSGALLASSDKIQGAMDTTDSPITFICPLDRTKKVFRSSVISTLGEKPVATLFAILDYDRAGTLIRSAVWRIVIVFLVGMTLAVFLTFLVARSIAVPIKSLSQAMEKMEAGMPEQTTVPVTRKDEIGVLVNGFNSMAARLHHQLKDLKKEIEERTQAEKSLADEKERLAVTLRSIGDAVITTDTKGNVVFLNKVAEDLTGWSNEDAQGQASTTVLHLINEKSGDPSIGPVQRVMESGQIIELASHTALIAKDGSVHNIADSGAPIWDRHNQIIGVVIVLRDITHELRMENELQKIKKLESIGVLAGGIAHDFNNILSAILGNIELSTHHLDSDRDAQTVSLLSDAKKAVLRAVSLTKQLLTFSRGGDPVKDSTALPELIRDSAEFVLHGSHVSCEYRFSDDLWMAEADGGQLSQVIQNIILNAKHAMAMGGRITITASNVTDISSEPLLSALSERLICITIEDTGVGIPQEIIDKIFDPYFTTKPDGSGLGLAICHSIISKHNGLLTVRSVPRQGTTFTIYLPAAPVTSSPAQPSKESFNLPGLPAKIMVLDDEEMIRDTVKLLLSILGHEVIAVADGAEAVRQYQASHDSGTPVDLVIMDLTIPAGMGGKEAAQILLEKYPDARLIVSSGYSNDPVMSNFRSYGFRASLSKPFDLDDLQKGIAQALCE
jgi:PAS domain S-box-containing protein